MRVTVIISPINVGVNLLLFLCFPFVRIKTKMFQQPGGLVTKNIHAFWLQEVALYFKAMPNLIKF